MRRASGIAGAFVVALGLAPISADAQQIFACVNNSSGTIHIVAQNVPCQSNETSLVWSAGGPQAGTVSAFEARCQNTAQVQPQQPIPFDSTTIKFGTGIGFTGGSSFVLQPGWYNVDWSGDYVQGDNSGPLQQVLTMTGQPAVDTIPPPIWFLVRGQILSSFNGSHLLHVLQPNTTLTFTSAVPSVFFQGCRLVITQLQ